MGLDCPNVKEIIHWGPSSTVEDYVQEIGRAGRDSSLNAKATIFFAKCDQQYTTNFMMKYCKNISECRRTLLFSGFDDACIDVKLDGCNCCDICAKTCSCGRCEEFKSQFMPF